MSSDEYVKQLQNLGWLVFINARAHILENRTELVEAVYLLTATFTHLIMHLPERVVVSYFHSNNLQICTTSALLHNLNAHRLSR